MAYLPAPSVLLSTLNGSCEERPHTSRDPAVVALSRAEVQICELKSYILLNTQMIAERSNIIEQLRREQHDLLSRLEGFENIALKTMEKLSQAENFILLREECLRQSQLSDSTPDSQVAGPLSTGPVVGRGRRKLNRPAGISIARPAQRRSSRSRETGRKVYLALGRNCAGAEVAQHQSPEQERLVAVQQTKNGGD